MRRPRGNRGRVLAAGVAVATRERVLPSTSLAMRSVVAITLTCLVATLASGADGANGISFSTALSPMAKSSSLRGMNEVKIVGGRSTTIVMHPYMVSVEKYFTFVPKWFHNCGGSIIDHYNVLSAAHCIEEEPKAAYRVRAGSSTRGKGGVVVPVAKVFYHPRFNPTALDYDVGIYRLKSSLAYSFAIQPIRFPKIGDTPKPKTKLQIVGWGATAAMAFEYPLQLKQTQVAVEDRATCAQNYKSTRAVTRRMVCAAGPGKDACTGDSGGPMVSIDRDLGKVVQHGIVSWGDVCAQKNHPGVYCSLTDAEIRGYIDGILKTK